jgi:predicted nucleic acid-binding protein
MISPAWGPFLFDTSAESWLGRSRSSNVQVWVQQYLSAHQVHVSAITVMERIRGYALMARHPDPSLRLETATMRADYLKSLGVVRPVDTAISVIAGEILALIPDPPTPPRRSHRLAESRQDRLVRWRFDTIIAATALVHGMILVHNNAADFEAIRSAIETSPGSFPSLGPLQLIRCDSLFV